MKKAIDPDIVARVVAAMKATGSNQASVLAEAAAAETLRQVIEEIDDIRSTMDPSNGLVAGISPALRGAVLTGLMSAQRMARRMLGEDPEAEPEKVIH